MSGFFLTFVLVDLYCKKISYNWNDILGFKKDLADIIKDCFIGIIGLAILFFSLKILFIIYPEILNKFLSRETSSKFLLGFIELKNAGFHGLIIASFLMFLGVVSEEIVFRGFMLKYLWNKYNSLLAIIFTTLLFSVIHIYPYKIFPLIIMGVILGISRVYTRCLLPPIIIHYLYNISLLLFENVVAKIIM
ncbi:MAG: CPBP family intramembrane metalloprotease [Elusimicrobia bacterium]|nr:CPBP family intramembrane metalloprotease [Elusimicrobiota bacterium]